MGEPIGPAKGTGSANRMWPPNVDHFSILRQKFDQISPKIYPNLEHRMTALCGKFFFSLGTHQGRANRPCKGDGVCD